MATAMSRLFYSAEAGCVDDEAALPPGTISLIISLVLSLGQSFRLELMFLTAVMSLSMCNYKPDTDSAKQASKLTWFDQSASGLYLHMPLILNTCVLTDSAASLSLQCGGLQRLLASPTLCLL